MTTWKDSIPQIANGQPVNAGFAGAPDRALENNVRWLKEQLDALSAATSLHDFDQPLDSAVVVGAAVYWNTTRNRYELAKAAVTTDTETGYLVLAETAFVVGICDLKSSATVGNILLLGMGTVDLANVVDADLANGRYFLSSAVAGHLTQQQPSVGIPVLLRQGGRVVVSPLPTELLLSHTHFGVELYATPAGTAPVPEVGNPHVITVSDTEQPGWLPADDDSFQDLAPAGAKFGYNLAAHQALQQLWPPVPLSAASLAVERPPLALVDDILVPVLGETILGPAFVRVDANGIWWFSDCYNQAPWPADYVGSDSSSSLLESVSSDADACGPTRTMRLKLYFNHMLYANSNSVVTSLQSDSPSLQVLSCGGLSASSGDLKLLLDLALAITTTSATGYTVFKGLADNEFSAGPVTEGIIAGSDNLTLSSTASRRLTPGDVTTPLVHQGIITATVTTEPGDRELSPEIIKLESAKERHHNDTDIPYIGFSAGQSSRILLIFNVPAAGLPTAPQLRLRVLLLGSATGTLPELVMTRVTATRPEDADEVSMPGEDDITAVAFDAEQAVTADSYLELESTAFDITAGDTIYISLARAASDDYAGEVGLLRINGIISAE